MKPDRAGSLQCLPVDESRFSPNRHCPRGDLRLRREGGGELRPPDAGRDHQKRRSPCEYLSAALVAGVYRDEPAEALAPGKPTHASGSRVPAMVAWATSVSRSLLSRA